MGREQVLCVVCNKLENPRTAREHLRQLTATPLAPTENQQYDNCPYPPINDSGDEDGGDEACSPNRNMAIEYRPDPDPFKFDAAPAANGELPSESHSLLHEMFGDTLLVFSDEEDDGMEEDMELTDDEGEKVGGFLDVDWDSFGMPTMSAWEWTAADSEREAAAALKLLDYDRAICRAFAYKIKTQTADQHFSFLRSAFPNPPLPKLGELRSRINFLAGFKPEFYNCCVNLCCCYTGKLASLQSCPYCKQSRFHANGKPRKQFTYIPLIPRLIARMRDRDMAAKTQYRSTHAHDPDVITDIFDGSCYRDLCQCHVRVDRREMLRLASGVIAFDILKEEMFKLHAFLIIVFGDIPTVSMLMQMKGHNGIAPCHMCKILAIRNPPENVHYVPHDRTNFLPTTRSSDQQPSQPESYNPASLPLRTHEDFMKQAAEVQSAQVVEPTRAEELAKQCGIKGIPSLALLQSLSFLTSFPYDFMHLIWENLVKNLVLHWTGDFKGLDSGVENYTVESAVWKAVGKETAESGKYIPSAYGSRVPDITADKSNVSAEMWSFWTLYLAPILLRRRFSHSKYFAHFILLVRLLSKCLQFKITRAEVGELRAGFILWVKTIEAMGPVWCYWAFPMERYCGHLQPAIRSRRFPYRSLDHYVFEEAQLSQIKLVYGLRQELSLRESRGDPRASLRLSNYPTCILLPPHSTEQPPQNTVKAIAGALRTRFTSGGRNPTLASMLRHLKDGNIERWGRVRRIDSEAGDTIRASDLGEQAEDYRDASYVRYELKSDKNERYRNRPVVNQEETRYGQLKCIYVIRLTAGSCTQLHAQPNDKTIILAAIRSCKLENDDPQLQGLDIHFYKSHGPLDIVDITTVQCLVGRVKDDVGGG
ncbi:hypothetical protein V5O48_016681, partial [Marasmius crinis-equi]